MSGYYFGFGAVLVFWIISYLQTGEFEPWALAVSKGKSKDNKPMISVSKFQVLYWTLIVLFSYASVFGTRFLDSHFEVLQSLPEIPLNLFLLMGLSVTTAAGSKGLKISYIAQGSVGQQSTGPTGDLQKTQLLTWNIIGGFIYLMSVFAYISTKSYSQLDAYGLAVNATLPDVDSTLLVLMGVSSASYLGNKIVNKDSGKIPRIFKIEPTSGPINTEVIITGENFGVQQGENYVLMHGEKVKSSDPNLVHWTDNEIKVKIKPDFEAGDIELIVVRDNINSNKEKFTVTKIPKIVKISPTSGPINTEVIITGENFGVQQGENYLLMKEEKIKSGDPNLVSWTDNEIKVKIKPDFEAGDIELIVVRDNINSNKEKFTVT